MYRLTNQFCWTPTQHIFCFTLRWSFQATHFFPNATHNSLHLAHSRWILLVFTQNTRPITFLNSKDRCAISNLQFALEEIQMFCLQYCLFSVSVIYSRPHILGTKTVSVATVNIVSIACCFLFWVYVKTSCGHVSHPTGDRCNPEHAFSIFLCVEFWDLCLGFGESGVVYREMCLSSCGKKTVITTAVTASAGQNDTTEPGRMRGQTAKELRLILSLVAVHSAVCCRPVMPWVAEPEPHDIIQ